MKVARWGNSLALRIPKDVAAALDLKEGDEVEVAGGRGKKIEVSRRPGREESIRELRRFRGAMPPDYRFDRDEANGR
jgi:antitoxin MazE